MAGEDVVAETVASMWHVAWEQSRGPKGRHAELRAHGEEQLRRYLESPGWIDTTSTRLRSGDDQPRPRRRRRPFRPCRQQARRDSDGRRLQDRTSQGGARTAVGLQLRAYAVGLAQREQADAVAVEFHYLQGAVTRVVADKAFLARHTATFRPRRRELRWRRAPGRSTEAVTLAVPAVRLPHRVRRGTRGRQQRRLIVALPASQPQTECSWPSVPDDGYRKRCHAVSGPR